MIETIESTNTNKIPAAPVLVAIPWPSVLNALAIVLICAYTTTTPTAKDPYVVKDMPPNSMKSW